MYVQLYIYNPDSTLGVRNCQDPHLRGDILKTIHDCLLQYNIFPARQASVILNQSNLANQIYPLIFIIIPLQIEECIVYQDQKRL